MKLAVQVQYDENVEQVLQSVSKSGYRYVSMGFGSSDCFHHNGWEQDVLRIERLLQKNGLCCIQTHLPCYDLRVSSEMIDDAMENAQLRCVIAAGKLGAEWSAYHGRTAVNANYSPRLSLQHTEKALEKLVAAAQEHHTGVAIENIPLFPELYWMRFLGSDVEDLCQICEDFASPALGICWDFGHAHLMKHDEAQMIRTAGKYIRATHIHNNYQMVDEHALPTVGTINWQTVMNALKDCGYDGYLTQELNYSCDERLDSFMAHSYECGVYLGKLMKRGGEDGNHN